MNTAPAATAPIPPVTLVEKAAMTGAVLLLGVLLAIPFTRGLAVDSVITVAHFIADTTVNVARALGSVVGLA